MRSPASFSANTWLGTIARGASVPLAIETYTGVTGPTLGAALMLTDNWPCCGVATTLGVCSIGADAMPHPEIATAAASAQTRSKEA